MKATHRPAFVATILACAWLAGACTSPLPPSPPLPLDARPVQALVSLMGRVEGAADPDSVSMPVSGATISIAPDGAGARFSTVTDENGWYEVAQVKGFVTVTVTKEGYETEVREMELSEETVLNFELKRAE